MNPFPEEHELISLLESEPLIYDQQVPFFYNHLTYSLTRSNGTLHFEIEPGSQWARIIWKQEESIVVDIELESIQGLEIERRNGQEFMHFIFYEDQRLKKLILKTKPMFSLSWGTERD